MTLHSQGNVFVGIELISFHFHQKKIVRERQHDRCMRQGCPIRRKFVGIFISRVSAFYLIDNKHAMKEKNDEN